MRRRAARAGAALVLVGLSVTLRERLDQAGVSALYTTFPSVANALLVLGSVPAHGAVAQVGPDAPIANDTDGTSTAAHDPPRTSG